MANKVHVHLPDDWDKETDATIPRFHTYEDKKVGLGPDGTLIVTEVVPDVSGKSKNGTVENMVALYGKGEWIYVRYE